MKKIMIFISSLLMIQNASSKETSNKSTLNEKLKSEGVLSSTKSVDSGKTGGGGNVGPRIQK